MAGCETNSQQEADDQPISAASAMDSARQDTAAVITMINEKDRTLTDTMDERLRPVRENFKRINAITHWTKVDTTNPGEALEGSEALLYYLNGQLEKITAKYLGETYRQTDEYYLLNGALSFMLEKTYRYNRPIYYDSAAMKAENDTEAFDFNRSTIIEARSYFENGKLIYQVNSRNKAASHTGSYLLKEQKRINAGFQKLKKRRL
ncbi:hypothetical protein [Agriterribacter sp.]|uniref:hypothetical protein n=1 Tax=Agriterribacter sp. TaxID=2821509 RepID=UPI002CB88EF3|nr:hypothetical protein [Agriterribacter sp.]HRO46090.1 hypothetical protein [Agriterribacter sp.]HRQ16150.1 hypothetical protein [Agriterribacter sp.]